MYTYKTVDLEQVGKDARTAIADVAMRYAAGKIENVAKADVILQGDDIEEFFRTLVADYGYDGIYQNSTDKRIGDMIQKDIRGDALSIGWRTVSKADAFDRDGVLLSPVRIVEQGRTERITTAPINTRSILAKSRTASSVPSKWRAARPRSPG